MLRMLQRGQLPPPAVACPCCIAMRCPRRLQACAEPPSEAARALKSSREAVDRSLAEPTQGALLLIEVPWFISGGRNPRSLHRKHEFLRILGCGFGLPFCRINVFFERGMRWARSRETRLAPVL